MNGAPPDARRLDDLVQLRRVRDRIARDYAEPLDVEALARGANMSAGHLSRQFRLAFGESLYSYLMTRRIEREAAGTNARSTAGIPPCVAKQVTRPVRNREATPSGRS